MRRLMLADPDADQRMRKTRWLSLSVRKSLPSDPQTPRDHEMARSARRSIRERTRYSSGPLRPARPRLVRVPASRRAGGAPRGAASYGCNADHMALLALQVVDFVLQALVLRAQFDIL